jgi:ATP-dependent RNA helicase DeaD
VGAIRLQNDHAQVELLPSIEKDFERFGHRLIERGLITEGRKSYKAVEKRGKKPFRQRKKR